MRTIWRIGATSLAVGLLAAPTAAPVTLAAVPAAVPTSEVSGPSDALATFDDAVSAARRTYSEVIAAAKAVRKDALAPAKALRARALRDADTKAERRLARRAYRRAAAPAKQTYAGARTVARANRDAALDRALADYLAATGQPEVAEALGVYRSATASISTTLELALRSAASTYRTDTVDEREALVEDLALATTSSRRERMWRDFLAATADERTAYNRSVRAARAAYRSAMSEARADFKASAGLSIKALLKLVS